ncbi:MAG: hypothetical protein ACM31D_08780 [Bacteroidota bacterium]
MKRLLIGIACALAAWSMNARAEETRAWDFAGTRVAIEDTQQGQRLTVRRGDAEPLSLEAWRLSVRDPAGANLTGGTTPQLVVNGWSGGTQCCYTVHLLDIGEHPHVIQSFDTGHSGSDPFTKFDDDEALEITLPDWSFANWPGSLANSPVPHVILHWDGRQYVPSPKLMRAGTMLYQMQERRQPRSEEETISAIFQDTLDMIYAGRWKAARTLLKQLLPPTPDNKRLEQEFFDCKLPSSPFWPFVAGLNNVPAKPVAAGCPAKAG